MKKLLTTLMVVMVAVLALTAKQIWVYMNDGSRMPLDFARVDSISLAEPGLLVLTPATKTLPYTGGRFTVTVQANKPWTATVDDPTALTLSAASGYGNGTLTCTAVANGDEVPYSAVITFTLEDGTVADLPVTVEALVVEPARLTLSPTRKSAGASGERFTVTVTSNKAWSVTANQPWVTLSANSGSGNGSFSVLVAANETTTSDNATITVTTASGNVTQTVAIIRAGQTGTLQGHDYVDLGLPSGTLWATCNVGANSPEEYGDYFAWGETTPKSYYEWSTYKYGTAYNQLTKYCNKSDYGKNGFTDNRTTLDAVDDAATANWGSGWRMPTLAEIEELNNNCSSTWITQNGVKGRKFTASNGNSIFLPAAGRYDGSGLDGAGRYGEYWSGSLYTGGPGGALQVYIASGSVDWGNSSRCRGQSVRPVVKQNSSPFVAELSITPVQQSVGAAGGSFEVTVASNTSWLVTANQPWMTLSANSGSGNGSFSVLVVANETSTFDNATITVTTATGNVTQTVAITRAGQPQGNGTLQGHDYVDLVLPSGTLWATCNVGANSPEEYGDYFAWGETTPKYYYWWDNLKYCTNFNENTWTGTFSKYTGSDGKMVLDAEDDAATANWGDSWRMPTLAEIQELLDNTTATWTTQNGVSGRKFTASNGNSIFLPAAGCYGESNLDGAGSGGFYRSGSLDTRDPNPYNAYYILFSSDGVCWSIISRCYGLSVRPVVNQ